MPRIRYIERKFGAEARSVIRTVNAICAQYATSGYDLTLRQLYYQFVARDLFPPDRKFRWTGRAWVRDPNGTPNATPNYKWLGDLVNDGRMAGLIDWDYIVDRTRNLRQLRHWASPGAAIKDAARQYQTDMWRRQPERVELWVEKDALIGVVERVGIQNDVPFFSCRGYTSQSEMWSTAQRIGGHLRKGQGVTILHLGDHDPSGIDMSRDIEERIRHFVHTDQVALLGEKLTEAMEQSGYGGMSLADTPAEFQTRAQDAIERAEDSWGKFGFERIALNMDQIEVHSPPPNPAKVTDSRYRAYRELHGDESWELDALPPDVLAALMNEAIDAHRNVGMWNQDADRMRREQDTLTAAGERWADVAKVVGK